jgi:hypothetical protein
MARDAVFFCPIASCRLGVKRYHHTCTMCGDFCAMDRGLMLFEADISPVKTAPAEG